MDIVNAAARQKGVEEGREDESKEVECSECISHSMALQYVETSLHCMRQIGLEYSEVTATREICTATGRSLVHKTRNHCKLFITVNISCLKKM
jgi:hypothetical protein